MNRAATVHSRLATWPRRSGGRSGASCPAGFVHVACARALSKRVAPGEAMNECVLGRWAAHNHCVRIRPASPKRDGPTASSSQRRSCTSCTLAARAAGAGWAEGSRAIEGAHQFDVLVAVVRLHHRQEDAVCALAGEA
eukprot:scaffold106646_cov31-Tisochrysis_lutea.AAC.2